MAFGQVSVCHFLYFNIPLLCITLSLTKEEIQNYKVKINSKCKENVMNKSTGYITDGKNCGE